ncbi:ImmA/IrrE family metallo-endopeptidase [Kitasatospora sp. NPDC086791]|uniref:ImmA/IrrE family metallo-endopeptidase n=1 Tax=Kitasatospora sp. NPDC086791 TaxID=3155178 RepID=UPI0034433132
MSRVDTALATLFAKYTLDAWPVDPRRIAQLLDITIVEQPAVPDVRVMLLRKEGQTVIGVNTAHSPATQRLAIAHSIGHHQLHRGRPLFLDTDQRPLLNPPPPAIPTDREEAEANRYALGLLAPESLLRKEARQAEADTAAELVTRLARRFDLTERAMACHLMHHGIVTDPGDTSPTL